MYGRGDRAIGIGLGVVIGIAVVAAFVFLGSEDTVDAPSISGGVATTATPPPEKAGVPTVRIVGGTPPAVLPRLEFKRGDRVRFKVVSDSAVGAVEIAGLGQSKNVPARKPVTFDFPARKSGQFAVVVVASHITVATLRVGS